MLSKTNESTLFVLIIWGY